MIEGLKKAHRWVASRRILLSAAGLFWLAAVLGGTLFLARYSNSAGQAGEPPDRWPESSNVPHNAARPTLVMFVHPHCPCSRASVGELALLMARCHDRLEAHVFFLRPARMPLEWAQTDLWREAARIPGVVVHRDDDGREARCFAASTSGATALYDLSGQLLFHGGITAARGHSGDNAGRAAIQSLVLEQSVGRSCTPVFGCSLFDCSAKGAP